MIHTVRTAAPLDLVTFATVLLTVSFIVTAPTLGDAATADVPTGILPKPDYSGDLWQRAYLLGDLNGSRSELADQGVQFQVDLTQTLQSVVDGGLDTDTRYGGSLEYLLQLDFDRMGVVPGGTLKVRGESRYGETVNGITGQILPANTDGLVPLSDNLDDDVAITVTTVLYTQYLTEQFGVMVGKFDNFDSDYNEFASGRGTSQFMNTNLVFSPVTVNEPYSTLGGGVFYAPNENVTMWTFLYNTTDSSTTTGFDDVGDAWTWFAELYLQYAHGGKPGGMVFGGSYNFDADFDQIGSARLVTGPGGATLAAESVEDSWSAYWNLWQYLWTAEPVEGPINLEDGTPDHRGVGLFMRVGAADRDVNPIEWAVSGGIGGRGLLPSRDLDTFGVGLFYTQVQETRLSGLFGIDDHTQGLEAFYNVAVTPATHLTFDLQVLDSPLPDVDTAVLLGLRCNTRF